MELRQLEYFVAVAEERSFTRAAERVHVAQPGVSAQIRRLEAEFGEPLFDRSARQVRLTDVGRAVLPYARDALRAVRGARERVEELRGLLSGDVTLGMVAGCGTPDVPELLSRFHASYPDVAIRLVEDTSDRLLERVRAGELDLAFVAPVEEQPRDLLLRVTLDEPFVVVVDPSHELASETRIALTRLRGVALVSLPPGTGVRGCLDEACERAGFTPHVALEAGNPGAVATFAVSGLGPALLPASVAAEVDGLHVLATEPEIRGRLAFAWRESGPSSPAGRALVAAVRR